MRSLAWLTLKTNVLSSVFSVFILFLSYLCNFVWSKKTIKKSTCQYWICFCWFMSTLLGNLMKFGIANGSVSKRKELQLEQKLIRLWPVFSWKVSCFFQIGNNFFQKPLMCISLLNYSFSFWDCFFNLQTTEVAHQRNTGPWFQICNLYLLEINGALNSWNIQLIE